MSSEVKEVVAYQPGQVDGWEDPNVTCFESNPELSWRYFKNVRPFEHFFMEIDHKTYNGVAMTFRRIRHLGHSRSNFKVIGPFAKCRRARFGLGNWSHNPANRNLPQAAKKCLESKLNKIEIGLEITRWSFDSHLEIEGKANKTFMEFIEWRRGVHQWVAWWVTKYTYASDHVMQVRVIVVNDRRAQIERDAERDLARLDAQFLSSQLTAVALKDNKAKVLEEKKKELETLAKIEKLPKLDTGLGVDEKDLKEYERELIKQFQVAKMYATYIRKFDKVDPEERKTVEGGFTPRRRADDGQEVKKIAKPDTEHCAFSRNAFRKTSKWDDEKFKKNPYQPPSYECEEAYRTGGLIYSPPAFYNLADLSGPQDTAQPPADDKEADDQSRRDEAAAASAAAVVNGFNRVILDNSVVAIGFSMDVYVDAAGHSGASDVLDEIYYLRGPDASEIERQRRWVDKFGGGAGSGSNQDYVPKFKRIKGVEAYDATLAQELAHKVEDVDQTQIKIEIAASIAAEKERVRKLAEEYAAKTGKALMAPTPQPVAAVAAAVAITVVEEKDKVSGKQEKKQEGPPAYNSKDEDEAAKPKKMSDADPDVKPRPTQPRISLGGNRKRTHKRIQEEDAE